MNAITKVHNIQTQVSIYVNNNNALIVDFVLKFFFFFSTTNIIIAVVMNENVTRTNEQTSTNT